MKRAFLVAIALALPLGACNDDVDKQLDEAKALADKLCRCPDAACAEQVKSELEAMKARNDRAEHDGPSGKQVERAVKITRASSRPSSS